MTGAISQGVEQLSLAVFTTLAPAAAIAYIILALFLIFSRIDIEVRRRVERMLIVPIAMAFVGLMASTNHLGKPSNSLYVLSRIGESPLSTEVLCSVLFVGIIWITWFTCFSRRPLPGVRRALLALGALAALGELWGTANAYHIATVGSWYLPYTAANLVLQGIQGGLPTVALVLATARVDVKPRTLFALAAGTAAATVACAICGALQWSAFSSVGSGFVTVAEFAPFFPVTVAAEALLGCAACIVFGVPLVRGSRPATGRAVICFALVMCAVFVGRFGFYCTHLTAGLSW